MNVWHGIGNLTKDPDIKYKPGNDPLCICRMTVAINDGYGDKKTTYFIPVVCFGSVAENCERFLSKGSKVAIEGKIKTGSYEKDGQKIYTTDIHADKVEFLSGSQDNRLP